MRLGVICILLVMFASLYCEASVDVLKLKNGSIIKGVILEHKVGESLKIQTKDGSVYVFQEAEIDLIQKEEVVVPQEIKYDTAGVNGRVSVTQKSGATVLGIVQTVNPDNSIMLKVYGDNTPFRIDAKNITKIVSAPYPHNGSFGFGVGLTYGTIGFNGEIFITDHIGLMAGYGTAIYAPVWNVGTRLYLRSSQCTWRPRITALWGINSLLLRDNEYDEPDSEYKVEKFEGLTLGFGQQWMWGESKRHGMDLDLMYIATSAIYDRVEELNAEGDNIQNSGRVKINLGYKFSF
jgi:hypothetical protein